MHYLCFPVCQIWRNTAMNVRVSRIYIMCRTLHSCFHILGLRNSSRNDLGKLERANILRVEYQLQPWNPFCLSLNTSPSLPATLEWLLHLSSNINAKAQTYKMYSIYCTWILRHTRGLRAKGKTTWKTEQELSLRQWHARTAAVTDTDVTPQCQAYA